MLKDHLNSLEIKGLLDPILVEATGSSASVDLKNYISAAFYVYYGLNSESHSGSNKFECKLQESANDSSWSDVAADDVFTDGVATNANLFGVNNAAADDNAIYAIGYRGTKRYVKVVQTETGTAGCVTAIFALLEPDKRKATHVTLGA